MASLSFDKNRGIYRVWYRDGLDRKSVVVGRLPRGSARPRKDPPEVLHRFAEIQLREASNPEHRAVEPAPAKFSVFFAEYTDQASRRLRPASVRKMGHAAARFVRTIGDLPMAEIDAAVAQRFVDAAAVDMVKTSIRYYIFLFSQAWRWGVANGRVAGDPWGKDLVIPLPDRQPPRPSWTFEEYEKLAASARPWLRDILAFGCHTGLRIGELCAMEWSWVREGEGGRVSVVVPARIAKSKRERRVPLMAGAAEVVAKLDARGRDSSRILNGARGNPTSSFAVIGSVRKACGRAGVPVAATHAMRRSFGRWAVLGQGPFRGKPIPVYVVSMWLGHAQISTTEKYLALSEKASDEWMPD